MDMLTKVLPEENPATADTTELGVENAEGSRVLELIASIRESINQLNREQLKADLDNLSAIFRIHIGDDKDIHNEKIAQLLGWIQENDGDNVWNKEANLPQTFHDAGGIDEATVYAKPNINMVMKKPPSNDGNLGFIKTKPSFERELMLLKIYGIDSREIHNVFLKS